MKKEIKRPLLLKWQKKCLEANDSKMQSKQQLRQQGLLIRNGIGESLHKEKSEIILKKLKELPEFKKAKQILLYYSVKSEVSTLSLLSEENKITYLPRLISEVEFKALPFRSVDELEKNNFDIPEPPFSDETYEEKLDLIIIPGVAFDEEGNRIGMGKGYYDRYLKKINRIPRIALAFEEQMVDRVAKESYDEPVDMIITDQKTYRCSAFSNS